MLGWRLSSKVLIDATNPILLGQDLLKEGLVVGHKTSGAEQVASWASGARVVKGFNSVGWPHHGQPPTRHTPGVDADLRR